MMFLNDVALQSTQVSGDLASFSAMPALKALRIDGTSIGGSIASLCGGADPLVNLHYLNLGSSMFTAMWQRWHRAASCMMSG